MLPSGEGDDDPDDDSDDDAVVNMNAPNRNRMAAVTIGNVNNRIPAAMRHEPMTLCSVTPMIGRYVGWVRPVPS